MSYSTDHLHTAGKVTVYTALVGVVTFAVVFIFNLGTTEIKQAVAQQSATTTVTVLNTPPAWTATATEAVESSATNPTNAGDTVTWRAVGTDANSEDYYLLICTGTSTPADPTPSSGAAPSCNTNQVQWGVSAATLSGTEATVSTTTADSWSESNVWWAWICDGNAGTPRCNSVPTQGTNATNTSPFEVNHRPSYSDLWDNSPADPGDTVVFTSTSTDNDTSGTADTVYLFICATSGWATSTDTCSGTTLGSTTVGAGSNATATYTIVIPTQDQNYGAYGYLIDSHGFEATGTYWGYDSVLTVDNAAPTVSSSTIFINGGADMILTEDASQTPGFALQFTAADDNSCDAVGGNGYDEVVDFELSLYRSGVSSTTCTVASGSYDPNDCYPSGVASNVWGLSCTASSTSCTGSTDTTIVFDCTFPLWYIADPTDGVEGSSTEYGTQNWLAQVQAIDDDAEAGPLTEAQDGVEVTSFLAFALNTLSIPYGSLEPGEQSDPINATTTISATGNVGLDKKVTGESMCVTYTNSTLCPNSATSTIPDYEQRFATDTIAYASATSLSSTTEQEIEINVPKSTATSSQATADAYWGIRVPASITFSGDYTGENTFIAIVGESTDW